jgi:hypothetical protein
MSLNCRLTFTRLYSIIHIDKTLSNAEFCENNLPCFPDDYGQIAILY